MSRAKNIILLLEDELNTEMVHLAFIKKYPKLKVLFDKKIFKPTVLDKGMRGEEASFRLDRVYLTDKFLDLFKKDKKTALYVYLHEIGHGISSLIGLPKWSKKYQEISGKTIWDMEPYSMTTPFQLGNPEEAFAETFAVVYSKDKRGLSLLKKNWGGWIDLIKWSIKQLGVKR